MSFHNAPVAKGLMMLVGSSTLLCAMFDLKHYLPLQLVPHISRDRQFWRLMVHQFACANSSDLLLTEILLFDLSVTLERRFGSLKFASLLCVQLASSAVLNILLLLCLHKAGLNIIPPGPFTLVFALLAPYYRLIPTLFSFRIFGIKLSNKFQVYFLACFLASAHFPGSCYATLAGIVIGQIYQIDQLGLKDFRLSSNLFPFSQLYLKPLIGGTPPLRGSSHALPRDWNIQEESTTGPEQPPDGTSRSIVQDLVSHLRGREAGLRNPTREEVDEVARMFPNVPRQTLTVTLQRSVTTEAAVESILSTINEERPG